MCIINCWGMIQFWLLVPHCAALLAGPILLRIFCSALDTSLGGCWCELRNQGEARSTEEARTHFQSLEMQGKGDSCKVVLDGISSCLDCSGSSLQVRIFSRNQCVNRLVKSEMKLLGRLLTMGVSSAVAYYETLESCLLLLRIISICRAYGTCIKNGYFLLCVRACFLYCIVWTEEEIWNYEFMSRNFAVWTFRLSN